MMAWFRIDDSWHNHPKVLSIGNAAAGLWARCGAYCAQHGLEGRIPKPIAHSYGTRAEIGRLIGVGLWRDDGDVYVMRDWCDYNPSAAEMADRRSKRVEAGRLGGVRSGHVRRSKQEANSEANASAPASLMLEAKSNPYPTQPYPSEQVPTNSTSADTPPGVVGDVDNSRKAQVAEHYARIALEQARGVEHPEAYRRKARSTALEHPDIDRYLRRWPTAPADAIACWLHGDKHSMSYYPDAEDAALAPILHLRIDTA